MKKRISGWLLAARRRVPHALEGALTAFLFSAGLMLPLRGALDLAVGGAHLLLQSAGFSLFWALLSISPLTAAAGLAGGLCLFIPYVIGLVPQLSGMEAALALAMQGSPLALQLYSQPLSLLLTLLFTLVAFLLSQGNGGFYPAFALAAFVLLSSWFYGGRSDARLCLPALAALLLLYAHSGEHGASVSRALPTALCAALLAALLLPSVIPTTPAMTDFAERVRSTVYDYFFFTEPRSVYSLQLSGYQPLGLDQLGGPVDPPDDPVLEVATVQPVYLRGSLKNEYTGRAWRDSTAGRRYLFVDPRYRNLRDVLFDVKKPSQSLRDASNQFEEHTLPISLLADGVSTLFVPQRLTSVSSAEGFVPYFGSSSEVFITRDTVAGDAYSVTAALPTAGSAGLAEVLQSADAGADEAAEAEWNDVFSTYTAFPETVESGVVQLALQITAGAASPYERAQLIAGHLRSSYPYTFEQSIPPADRDFVSWFLLSERQGYCTSFASAMAVMCRIAGLPARYVEGYLARPDADGVARVTQQNAHAWVEVYFKGFGWLTFDPTPSRSSSQGGGDLPAPPEDEPPEDDAQGAADPSDGQDLPTPSPDPSQSSDGAQGTTPTPQPNDQTEPPEEGSASDTAPTPTPTPTAVPPDDKPQETPEPEDIPTPSPTPSPEPPGQHDPTPTPPPENPPPKDPPRFLLWLLPLLLLAAACLRLYWTDPAQAASRQKDDGARLLCWYRGVESALRALGYTRSASESLLAFAQRAERALGKDTRLTPFVRAVCLMQYGGREASSDWLRRAERAYRALCRRLTPTQRAQMLLRRMIKGLGSLKTL